jgi:hypothetical protein
MGFWHTGYMEFHEPTGESGGSHSAYVPKPPEFPCEQCGVVFQTLELLNMHRFDGHASRRARLFLQGRECGRSRTAIITATEPTDWTFDNAIGIRINDVDVTEDEARAMLCAAKGVVTVGLRGGHAVQDFEFAFEVAHEDDLAAVDSALDDLIVHRSLSISSIQLFLERCQRSKTSAAYSDGLANYLYGVLAREQSPESSLWQDSRGKVTYRSRFDDAVSRLGALDRAAADAVCGLVGFHYNHFDIAMRKTRSPRVARVSERLASIIGGVGPDGTAGLLSGIEDRSLDRALSDAETERVLNWCAIPLDGSARESIDEIEDAIVRADPLDRLKLHLISGEHYLAAGQAREALRHADDVRHTAAASSWQSFVRQRANVNG